MCIPLTFQVSTSYLPRLLNVVRTTSNFGGACFSGLQISLLDTAHFSSFKNKCLNCNISSFQFSSDPLKPHPLALAFTVYPRKLGFHNPSNTDRLQQASVFCRYWNTIWHVVNEKVPK